MCMPRRFGIAIQVFCGFCISYMMRVNFSMLIIGMFQSPVTKFCKQVGKNNGTWTSRLKNQVYMDNGIQCILLSCYFEGFGISCFIGARILRVVNPVQLVGMTTLISALATACIPFASDVVIIGILRFIMGIAGGCVLPCMQHILYYWAPPSEKYLFLVAYIGSNLGASLTPIVMGYVIEYYKWEWGFYFSALVAIIWSITWFLTVYESPGEDPAISDEERLYIQQSVTNNFINDDTYIPYEKLFTSISAWSVLILYMGMSCEATFSQTLLPKFYDDIGSFSIFTTGVYSAIPLFFRGIIGALCMPLFYGIRYFVGLRTSTLRKCFLIVFQLIPAFVILSLAIENCGAGHIITVISLAFSLPAVTYMIVMDNCKDLAPRHAGVIFGMINGIAGLSSGAIILFFGLGFYRNEEMDIWLLYLIVIAFTMIATTVFYVCFGKSARIDDEDYDYY